MTTPTVSVSIVSGAITGAPLANGSATLQLTAPDIVVGTNGGIVSAAPITVALDVNGLATVNSFPNTLGTAGTQTKVTLFDSTGAVAATALATIPNTACNLHDVIDLAPPPSLTGAQVGVNLARLWAFGSTPPDGVNKSAKSYAGDAGANAALTAADRAQTGLDRTQTGLDRVQADADLASVTTLTQTATAQAALAISSAASAASAVQQDLSGVTGGALHRSPNAIVAMITGDCRQDSDAGAWRKRMQGASWYTEALNGTWLGWQVSETAARAVGGTLGAESITGADPGFGSATGWATGTGASVSGGLLNLSSVANGVGATTTGTLSVIGTVYKVTCTRSLTAGGVRVTYGGKTFDFYATGPEPIYLVATAASTTVSVTAIGTTTGSVDVVSIKPVTANVTNTWDFYGDSTTGRFWTLSAGSGVTEVFRGNTADFPEQYAVVAEASRVVIYDLTQPGRPMAFVFTCAANQMLQGTITSVAAKEGCIVVGTNSGAFVMNVAKDSAIKYSTAADATFKGTIAQRNLANGYL